MSSTYMRRRAAKLKDPSRASIIPGHADTAPPGARGRTGVARISDIQMLLSPSISSRGCVYGSDVLRRDDLVTAAEQRLRQPAFARRFTSYIHPTAQRMPSFCNNLTRHCRVPFLRVGLLFINILRRTSAIPIGSRFFLKYKVLENVISRVPRRAHSAAEERSEVSRATPVASLSSSSTPHTRRHYLPPTAIRDSAFSRRIVGDVHFISCQQPVLQSSTFRRGRKRRQAYPWSP